MSSINGSDIVYLVYVVALRKDEEIKFLFGDSRTLFSLSNYIVTDDTIKNTYTMNEICRFKSIIDAEQFIRENMNSDLVKQFNVIRYEIIAVKPILDIIGYTREPMGTNMSMEMKGPK